MSEAPGIYVHVPFCSHICPYCDFAVVRDSEVRRRRFADLLIAEIERVEWSVPEGFDTLYFGGGTPSLLSADDLGLIVEALRARFDGDDLRIHLEANPEDVDPRSVQAWGACGVEFLSLGVQALDDGRLAFLGREHNRARAVNAVEVAAAGGFATVSMDLIYGHIGHSLESWTLELESTAALPIDHLSCYSLTVSPATPFGQRAAGGEPLLPDQERQAEFFLATHHQLADLGLKAYEVSNFACSRGHRSRHNQKYWRGVPYLGLGPSAHSFDGTRRWWNLRHEGAWSAAVGNGESAVEASETLTVEQRRLELVMLGLRTLEGVGLEWLGPDSGLDLEDLQQRGLAECRGGRLVLTVDGWVIADRLAAVA